ncbi:MAG: 50S ribosomal protein L9 [Thermodesulfobacteriota bacterium]|nr:50S ribosomal protein L9 [Thermodesulfobacteriota bacterium]
MKVILRETIDSLGTVGDEVSVADGYARNYLVPQKKAVLATPGNRRLVEQDKKKLEVRAIKDKGMAEALAEKIQGAVCTISAKVSEEDRLYGSVTTRDVADQLLAQGLEVEKRMIMLSEPIKSLGSYIVPVQLHPDVKPEITVKVVAEE